MMQTLTRRGLAAALAIVLSAGTGLGQTAASTDVTYQGVLESGGAPANGLFDIEIRQFDAAIGGTLESTSMHPNVLVTDGVFTISDVAIDMSQAGSQQNWFEIRVRPAGGGAFTTLSPRQPATQAPSALAIRGFETIQSGAGILVARSPAGESPLSLGSSFIDNNGFIDLFEFDSGRLLAQLDVNSGMSGATGLMRVRSTGGESGGNIQAENDSGTVTFDLLGGTATDGATLRMFNEIGAETFSLVGDNFDGPLLRMRNAATGVTSVILQGTSGGFLGMQAADGTQTVAITADSAGGGTISLRADDGSNTVFLDGDANNEGGVVSVRNDTSEETVAIIGDDGDDAGLIQVINRNGLSNNVGVALRGRESAFGTGGVVEVFDNTGMPTIELDGQNGTGGDLSMREVDGSTEFRVFNSVLTLFDSAGVATITMNGNTGAKNGVVALPSYGQRLMYAVESTEVWFDDMGSGRLVNGAATIALDPMFLESVTIDNDNPLKVFVTLTGPANGVWVEKFSNGFVVHELMNGTSNSTFDYRVVAKRRGLEHARMERFADTQPVNPEPSIPGRAARHPRADGDDTPVRAHQTAAPTAPASNLSNTPGN